MLNAAKWMAETSGVTAAFGPVPDGVDVYPREGNGKKTLFSSTLQQHRRP
jgi:beta-galactosidase